jgi:hypothetical protein
VSEPPPPDDPAPAAPPENDPAIAAALIQLDLGSSPAAPLQRAAVAALAWLGELDRSGEGRGATRPR